MRPRGRGHLRLAFGLFLILGVLFSGWPMLQHVQRRIALDAEAAALLSRPLEAELASLLRHVERLSLSAGAYHELLESAEAHLWEFKNNRETSLILKDVGDEDGELGLRALQATYSEVTASLTHFNTVLAQAERDWKALRDQTSPERLRKAGKGLQEAVHAAKLQGKMIARYKMIAEETGQRADQFRRLAPQVVGRVPLAVNRLPDQLQQLQAAILDFGEALDAFQAAPSPQAGLGTNNANAMGH